ncbi:unnamed protein product, partial [Rotaria magnacalcarata]
STAPSTAVPTPSTVTNDRLVLLPSGSNATGQNTQTSNSSATTHLNVPRLNARSGMASSLFGESHSRRQIAPVATTSPSLGHASAIQQQQTHAQQQQQQSQPTNTISVNTTNSLLARAFGILIRQITDLLIKWPAMLSASSLYHDIVITSSTIDEQNAVDTIQVSNIS